MSGIYGIVRLDGGPVRTEDLAPMKDAMAFWGPDGHGQWLGQGVGLGHLMLRVTPESAEESQPTKLNSAPHLVITGDARIDNREELAGALGICSPDLSKMPDCTVILLAYQKWREDCAGRLLGDFSFAIWDTRARELFCARDHFGCKPFLYYQDRTQFIFASDIRGILSRVASPRLNEPLIAAHLVGRICYAERNLTFFERIHKLPKAHTALVTTGGCSFSQYWKPDQGRELRRSRDTDYVEELKFLFQRSVACRTRSSFPVASHLSGGLDSSAVTVFAAQQLRLRGDRLKAYSWVPSEIIAGESEQTRIQLVCRDQSIDCEYLSPTQKRFIDVFSCDFTTQPTDMMAWEGGIQDLASKSGVRVILSGWGGDEAVSVYTDSYIHDLLRQFQWPSVLKALRLNDRLGVGSMYGFTRALLLAYLPDSGYVRFRRAGVFPAYPTPCIRDEFANAYRREIAALRNPPWRTKPSFRSHICHRLDYGHLEKRMEHWATSGARRNLEYRYPLLDKRVIEFVLSVPPKEFIGYEGSRSLFLRAMNGQLPRVCDWRQAKVAPATRMSLNLSLTGAYRMLARTLLPQTSATGADRFIDPRKIAAIVERYRTTDKLALLDGLREAFGCFGIAQHM